MDLEAKVSDLISMSVGHHPCYGTRLLDISMGTYRTLWRYYMDIFTEVWSRSKMMRRKKAILENDHTRLLDCEMILFCAVFDCTPEELLNPNFSLRHAETRKLQKEKDTMAMDTFGLSNSHAA